MNTQCLFSLVEKKKKAEKEIKIERQSLNKGKKEGGEGTYQICTQTNKHTNRNRKKDQYKAQNNSSKKETTQKKRRKKKREQKKKKKAI